MGPSTGISTCRRRDFHCAIGLRVDTVQNREEDRAEIKHTAALTLLGVIESEHEAVAWVLAQRDVA